MHGGYSTIYATGLLRRSNSLTDVRSPPTETAAMISAADDPAKMRDRMPVYAVVSKPTKMKRPSSEEKLKPGLDEYSQLYSKVDKSKKKAANDQTSDVPAEQNAPLGTPEVGSSDTATDVPPEVDAIVSDGAYETILSSSPKVDDGYDTVGGDFGYDSVDVVESKGRKDRLPSLATLLRGPERIYDVVPETLTDLRPPASDDYDHIVEIPNHNDNLEIPNHIAEIPTEKV